MNFPACGFKPPGHKHHLHPQSSPQLFCWRIWPSQWQAALGAFPSPKLCSNPRRTEKRVYNAPWPRIWKNMLANPLHLGASEGMYLIWALLHCPHQWTKSSRFSPRTLAHQDKSCQDVTLVSSWITRFLGALQCPVSTACLPLQYHRVFCLVYSNLIGFLSVPRLHLAFFLPQGLCCCTFFAWNAFDRAISLLFFVPWQNFKSLKWGFL